MSDDLVPPATVSLSRPLGSETPRHPLSCRDSSETKTETAGLKALAQRVLDRDAKRDCNRDTLSRHTHSTRPPGETPDAWYLPEYSTKNSATIGAIDVREIVPATSGPLILRDGRVMHRFHAGEIPASPSPDTARLLDKVRRMGAVLVADGSELHVVERWQGQMHPNVLRALRDNAGDVIAVLRYEHRERVARLPTECVSEWDPTTKSFLQRDES